MKQVFMKKNLVRRAKLSAEEVPAPVCGPAHVLLAARYSLISAGTESASVRRSVKDMVVKAATDPELRQAVKDMLFKDGVRRTAERVHYETTKWTPMGYSGAGAAIEVGGQVDGIQAGDLVAYGGEGHAEVVRAAKNLCVRVPEGVSAREAAFVAVGSIALQAVRRAEVQVGDVVVVLGLGLVGQLCAQLLGAAGARVLGAERVAERLQLGSDLGMEHGFAAGDSLPKDVLSYTRGVGADRVLICASTPSNAVIEQAVEMARDRGRVVIVGAVGMDVPHAPFYQKELDLVISRSYGPGRYDPLYEEKGIDYPVGYVRWTERRNMEEFLRLVQLRKVDVGRLITHEFGLEQLEEAYSLLLERPSECLAVLLRYPEGVEASKRKVVLRAESAPPSVAVRKGNPRVAVIGCGAFARQFHLPNLKRMAGVELRALVASSAQSSREFGERYGAAYCSTDWEAVLKDGDVDAVLVFTRDRSHARIASAALEAGKHVFCEKPLATSYEDCQLLAEALRGRSLVCTVGFNRRFAPLVVRAKETLRGRTRPCVLSYRVNAGSLPADSWIYDADHSAGRVVGEVCHFVDLCHHLVDSEPVTVFAQALTPAASQVRIEDILITLTFADGSAATVLYTASGSSAYGKERLEFFADGSVVVLDDFRSLTVRGRKRLDVRDRRGDKGHAAEIEHFGRVLRGEETAKVNAVDGLRAAVVCLKVLESVESGERVDVDLAEYA